MQAGELRALRRRLSRETLAQPVTLLRLPKKTETLQGAGIKTIGKLMKRLGDGSLLFIPGVGRSTVNEVARRLAVLDKAIDENGSIDWQQYAVASGLPLIPQRDVASGADFLAAFPEVIDAILQRQTNPLERLVLTERLLKQPGDQMTLEEIGQSGATAVSRERVRQLQQRLLGALSDALLEDEYVKLDFHFRKSFADMWKAAAVSFGERSEIGFGEFLSVLQETWKVDARTILPNLPLITAILTSKATIPRQLRPYPGFPARLLGVVAPEVVAQPVTRLPVQKAGRLLEELGVQTIGDLIDAGRANRLSGSSSAAGQRARRLLDALAVGLDDRGQLDWQVVADFLGLRELPAGHRSTAEEYFEHVRDDLAEMLDASPSSMRAAEIFRVRTSLSASKRPTLHETAQRLETHGPTVKREETLLLDMLHQQLVQNDFSQANIRCRADFLGWWAKAAEVFGRNRSTYVNFCAAVAREWQLPFTFVVEHADPVWAVLALYPHGRRPVAGRARKREGESGPAWTGGTILLRGFRRPH